MTATRPFISFSKPVYPPSNTNTKPIRLCRTAPQGCEIAPPVRLAMPSPVALVNAALTATVQIIRYTPKYAFTHAGRYSAQPSSAVSPVAS